MLASEQPLRPKKWKSMVLLVLPADRGHFAYLRTLAQPVGYIEALAVINQVAVVHTVKDPCLILHGCGAIPKYAVINDNQISISGRFD